MSEIKTRTDDPENYQKMSAPFESPDQADLALTEFFKEVGELRKKYKITDVLIVTKGSVKLSDGETGDWIQHFSYGNSLNQLLMAAYVYGQAQAYHEETISKLISGSTIRKRG